MQSADLIFKKGLFLDVENVCERERENRIPCKTLTLKKILEIRAVKRDCGRNGFLWYNLPVSTRRTWRFGPFSKNFTIEMLKTKLKGLEVGRGWRNESPL